MKEFIEKLIGRLEERKQLHNRMISYEQKSGTVTEEFQQRKAVEVLNYAISIVNQLAEEYNGDFCEWKKENSNKYFCNAHAEIHDSRVLDWCVCPYCGKKIKIVPYQPKGE